MKPNDILLAIKAASIAKQLNYIRRMVQVGIMAFKYLANGRTKEKVIITLS
ncbi:hypothetical protein [uncultured Flavobacterium sp.]|uniref:hypothetical protein n=1 Tax=uncultured Flavobacterium sp. TaxID=165435 RepID=UPI0030ED7027